MTRRPLWLCALGCGIVAAVWQATFAQAPKPGVADTRQDRPQANPLRVQTLTPELEALLKEWELNSAKITTLTGKHRRWEYNLVFQVEKRSEGKFFFQAPDKGRFDIEPSEIKEGEKSQRTDPKSGQSYQLQPGDEERWICNGEKILQIHDKDKTFEANPIPAEFRGANIVRSPLPFLFGLKAEEAKKRYHFKLHPSKNPDIAVLEIVPRTNQDTFRLAQVILNKRVFIPAAVKLFDLSGGIETSYVFSELSANNAGFKALIGKVFNGDPFNPALIGYKEVQPPDLHRPEVLPVNGQQPGGQKQQPGGAKITIQQSRTTFTIPAKKPASQPQTNRPPASSAPPKSASSGRQP